MAKINWIFTNQTTSNTFTTSVLSANYMYLRTSYKDYFAGSNLVITIKNQNDEAAGFSLNDRIFLNNLDGSGNSCWNQNYWVNEIEFNDYISNNNIDYDVKYNYKISTSLNIANIYAVFFTKEEDHFPLTIPNLHITLNRLFKNYISLMRTTIIKSILI